MWPERTRVHFTPSLVRFHLLPDNIVPPVRVADVCARRTAGVTAAAGRKKIQPEFKLCVTSCRTGERVKGKKTVT